MIRTRNLTKRFRTAQETVVAMDSLALEVESRLFFTLLGPSGCGKSTLLRCIAGLEIPDEGEIWIGDRLVFSSARRINVPPNGRRIGMVFQSYAIWPHMTVFENVAFPLEVQRKPNVREGVMKALAMVEMETLADRYASRLSGGQQQRIAFARAVVAEPDVLLLDEPLSNLDAALREQMRSELRRYQERLKVTTVYVTHDQAEALSMSDRIAVMRLGQLVEIATPEDLYDRPKTVFTAQFIGGANIVEGVAEAADGTDLTPVKTAFGALWTASAAAAGPVTLFIRPEKIVPLAAMPPGEDRNAFACEVVSSRFVGDSRELEFSLPATGAPPLRCKAPASLRVPADRKMVLRIDPRDVHVLAAV